MGLIESAYWAINLCTSKPRLVDIIVQKYTSDQKPFELNSRSNEWILFKHGNVHRLTYRLRRVCDFQADCDVFLSGETFHLRAEGSDVFVCFLNDPDFIRTRLTQSKHVSRYVTVI